MSISKENTRIIITINKNLKRQAEEVAKIENRALSNYIVDLIKKDIQKRMQEDK